jgi:hypothetical protein
VRQAFTNRPRPARRIEAEDLRELCELIKERHGMDTVIWDLRNSRNPDRHLVQAKMKRADAILNKIETIVRTFDHPEAFSNMEEYNKFREIKRRVDLPGKRRWMRDPPWNE